MAYRFKTRSVVPAELRLTDAAIANLQEGDYPDPGNVLEADSTNGVPGTYHEAAIAEVEAGVTFGPASAYTGTLSTSTLVAVVKNTPRPLATTRR